ncbi:MAG: hypothetical protein EXR54_01530 [Dehalococcoidia bacterium]|nr:hypothetical protein [Dehalococcoidia bacterium]MSQ16240.1 hypothetical protein [Dehalococcoidia bacterium]
MSTQSTGQPDWRRQPGVRRSGGRRGRQEPQEAAQPAPESSEPPGAGQSPEPQEPEVVVSRTLFSFLEPGLNAIASFGLPLVMAGVIALVAGTCLVAFVPSMRPYGWLIVFLGLFLVLLIGLVSLSSLLSAFLSRTGRYGVNSLVMVAAFLGIVLVAGWISFENHLRLDVTANQQFSLANNTRKLLDELDQPIKATAFYVTEFQDHQEVLIRRQQVEQTLREFKVRSSRFTYEFKDPDLEPEIARQYGITQYESVVVEGLDSKIVDIVTPTNAGYSQLEQDLYTSILVATGRERKKIYFLSGHAERTTFSSIGDGYSSLANSLERDNYEVKILSWDPTEDGVTVPDDAALLVIAGPTAALPQAHAQVLDLYLQGRNPNGVARREGGRMIFLAEPDTQASFRELLARWGVAVASGYIRDLDRSVPENPQTLRLQVYNPTAPPEIIVPKGQELQTTFMAGATSLQLVDDGLRLPTPLAITSANSYLISDVNRADPITEGAQADRKGPFVPAALIEAVRPVGEAPPASPQSLTESEIAKLVVFGDADFVSNAFFNRGSGADLFQNSANYLLGDYSLVSIRPKALDFREFNLDNNEHNFVRFSSWFFLPGLMGLAAALVWWVRR